MILFDNVWLQFVIAVFIVLILYIKHVPIYTRVFGVYRRIPNSFYIKFCIMYCLMKIRKRKNVPAEAVDKPQPLSEHNHAIDAVYFNGSSREKSILAVGLARRKHLVVNGFFMLRIPAFNEQMLVTPSFPDTCLYQTKEEYDNLYEYKVEGIQLTPMKAMQSWRIQYNGKMIFQEDRTKVIDVKCDAIWTTNIPCFNYDTDINPLTICKSIANEPWSREYFNNIENYHQTHYEQYGDVTGKVIINDIEYKIHTNSVRDHSFGLMRDWKNFHRYAMHFINLENDSRISVGVISIPVTFASIQVGFITDAQQSKNMSITNCNLVLHKHGEMGNPPSDYGFTFWTGCKRYDVLVKSYQRSEFFIGTEAECRIVEQFCEFNVNGIKGWGASEWQYRNVLGLESPKSN